MAFDLDEAFERIDAQEAMELAAMREAEQRPVIEEGNLPATFRSFLEHARIFHELHAQGLTAVYSNQYFCPRGTEIEIHLTPEKFHELFPDTENWKWQYDHSGSHCYGRIYAGVFWLCILTDAQKEQFGVVS